MMGLDYFRFWLTDIAELSSFKKYRGDWQSFDSSADNEYLSIMQTGGEPKTQAGAKTSYIALTLVSKKNANPDGLFLIVEKLEDLATQIPKQCNIIAVNLLSGAQGAIQSEQSRQVVTMRFEIITEEP